MHLVTHSPPRGLEPGFVTLDPGGATAALEKLGDYTVRRLLGEGGMGRVYEAEERLSKRRVALKVLHRELAKTDEGRRLFLNEMQILASLEHANIVRSLSNLELDGELVMVLELLEGRTLRDVLNDKGALTWKQAVEVAASVAEALAHAHARNPPVVHRDLKPENIMLLANGSIKVMDFGIAKALQAAGQTHTQTVGTLQYMSPEQIDARAVDHRSDLYCLGLVFYELLTGRAPFESASPRELLNLQCTADPPPFAQALRDAVPEAVEQLVFAMLEKAPEDRPFLADDVVERLAPFRSASRATRALAPSAGAAPAAKTAPSASASAAPAASNAAPSRPSSATPRAGAASSASAASSERRSKVPSEVSSRAGGAVDRALDRADTIALIDRAARGREVAPRRAVAIVAGLSIAAAIAAYAARAWQSGPAAGARPAASSTSFEPTRGANEPRDGADRDRDQPARERRAR